jgi:hypothetical protein
VKKQEKKERQDRNKRKTKGAAKFSLKLVGDFRKVCWLAACGGNFCLSQRHPILLSGLRISSVEPRQLLRTLIATVTGDMNCFLVVSLLILEV